jgi:hypothetical protein
MRLLTVAALATVSVVALAALTPASAQAPQRRYNSGESESITVIDQYGHRTTRVRIRPRSFLDPGNEVEPYSQHYMDYAFQPQRYPGEYLYDPNDWKSSWSRMPFPSCGDLPYFCRH